MKATALTVHIAAAVLVTTQFTGGLIAAAARILILISVSLLFA